ncbi:hypothetical protein SeMB42_g06061 [Synchytrium endobioticum]|uniref:LsmAD domain-containing protein n=1 Tax=Synchytrium endobioticum TaxID=286115 RepID=A0A507CMC6_9FUNG|nr:hypothetical protein SeMB42_g06061 [Synchytrium endobioticum]TPX41995.1 hypothetical protein SeLEV6574_g05819 [Synchytrium endobioticum]
MKNNRAGGGRGRGGHKENSVGAAHNNQNSSYGGGPRGNKWTPSAPNFANVAANVGATTPSSNTTTSKESINNSATDLSANIASPQAVNPHNPLLFILTNFVGIKVEVTIKSGTVYEGICHTCSTDGDVGICLKMVRKQLANSSANATPKYEGEVIKSLVILGKDVVAISAKDVDFSILARGPVERDSFQTDTAISGSGGDVKERTLQKWTNDGDAEALPNDTFGETHIGQWNQFEVNERLYGVTTDFNEDDYTVKIDKNVPDYKKREVEAVRLANEIEKSATTASGNAHLIEERGGALTEDLDEEGRYSAVLQSGRYVPPAQRRQGSNSAAARPNAWATPPQQQSHQLQQKSSSPIGAATTAATNSSHQKPPVPPPSTTQPTQASKSHPSSSRPTPVINPATATAASATPAISPAPVSVPAVPAVSAIVAPNGNKGNSNTTTPSQAPKSAPAIKSPDLNLDASTAPMASTRPSASALSKLSSDRKLASPAATALVKSPDELVEDVRQFVVKEQARVGKEKDHLQARKRDLMQQEKDVILIGFKKFSETFQLKTPVPDELKPILKKTGDISATSTASKIDERKKYSSVSPTTSSNTSALNEQKPAVSASSKSSKSTAASTQIKPSFGPSTSASTTNVRNSPSPPAKAPKIKEFKFNLDATEFRPAGAAEFIPQAAPHPVPMPFVPPPIFVPHMPPQPFMQPMPEKNGMLPEKTPFIMNRNPTAPQGAMKEMVMKNFNRRSTSGTKAQHVPPHWPGKVMNQIPVDPQHFGFAYPQHMQPYQYQRPNVMGRPPQAPFVPMQAFPHAPLQYFVPQFPPGGPNPMYQPQMIPPQPGGRVYSQKGHNMQPGYRPDMYAPGPGGRPPAFVPAPQYQQPPMMYPPEMIAMQPNMMVAPMEWAPDQIAYVQLQ